MDWPSTTLPAALARTPRDPARMRTLRLEIMLGRLPKDVGIVLLMAGTVGLIIPGPLPPGLTFLAIGAVVISPKLLRPFGGQMQRRLPLVFRVFEEQVSRLHRDLERRYPGSTGHGRKAGSGRR